jgi:HAMP domain-containing protein
VEKQKSIRRQFNIVLISLYLLSLLIALPLIYYTTSQEVYNNANKELTLLVDMVQSMRTYIRKDVRPELLKQKVLHAPAISSTVATRYVSGHFRKLQPKYYIKTASDNPLNLDNRPLPLEQEILEYFRKNRDQKVLTREGKIQGQRYLVSSRPSVSRPKCNLCHATPEKTPKEIVKVYGKDSGYGYKIGEVVGVSVVGVPLSDITVVAVKRGLMLVGLLTFLFTLVVVVINLLVKNKILNPLEELSSASQAISRGALDRSVKEYNNDEIGTLAHSIELMRRSLKEVMDRLSR